MSQIDQSLADIEQKFKKDYAYDPNFYTRRRQENLKHTSPYVDNNLEQPKNVSLRIKNLNPALENKFNLNVKNIFEERTRLSSYCNGEYFCIKFYATFFYLYKNNTYNLR